MNQPYEQILNTMATRYTELTGCSPANASDIGIRLKVLAGELANLYLQIEQMEQTIFPQTCSSEFLDLHGEMRGIERTKGNYATGELLFRLDKIHEQDVVIPSGIVAATYRSPQEYFATTQTGIIPTGKKQILIPAIAKEIGPKGNATPKTITVLISNLPQSLQVTNLSSFSGGSSSENDEHYRKRIVSAFQYPPNGTNCGFYYQLLMEIPQIKKATILPRREGRGFIDVVLVPENDVDVTALKKIVFAKLTKEKEISVDFQVLLAEKKEQPITVEIELEDGYVETDVFPLCQEAIKNYLEQLQIGESFRTTYLGKELLQISGVRNYKIITPSSDVLPGIDEILICSRPIVKKWRDSNAL